jgi:hypothetical protein
MPIAGYNSVVKAVGTAVPVTGEAAAFVSGSDPNKLYQVTNTARRIWDPAAAITVKDGGSTVGAGLYVFDYLTGKIQFVGYTVVGAITVDGSYIPTVAVAEICKYDLKIQANLPDVTSFDSAGWHQFIQALKSFELNLEMWSSPLVDLDAGAGGVQSLFSFLTNDTPKVYEIARGGQFWRGWYRHEMIQDSADVDGVLKIQLGLKGSAQGATAALSLS